MGISLASVDLENLVNLNKYKNEIYNRLDKIFIKYNSINVTKVHEKAKRGGFFGGYFFDLYGDYFWSFAFASFMGVINLLVLVKFLSRITNRKIAIQQSSR